MSEDVGENEEPIKSSSVVHQDDGAVLAPHGFACNHHLHPTQLLHQKLKLQIFEMYLYILEIFNLQQSILYEINHIIFISCVKCVKTR